MTTPARRRMTVEERRQQLTAVALDLFSRRPPEEVSVDEIAAAAGISRPLVYHYFPGKTGLYEAALQRAADDLADRFTEPRQGPLGERLLRVMQRFFDFVEAHGAGFAALLRSGPALTRSTADTAGTGGGVAGNVVASVRRTAYEQVLLHLGLGPAAPPARLEFVVRSWIALAESTALLWLDGLGAPPPPAAPNMQDPASGRPSAPPPARMPRRTVERQLVYEFGALLAVAAAHDEETAEVFRRLLKDEPSHGVFADLAARLTNLLPRGPEQA